MKRINTKMFVLLVLVAVICGLFYYTYLYDNAKNKREASSDDEINRLLNYDFDENYPKTVRETVKLYNKYLKYAYNGSFSEDELVKANQNMRQLFDEELLEYNPEEVQLDGLKSEIQHYEEEKQKFVSFSVAEGSQVETNKVKDVEYAKIKVTLVIQVKTTSSSVNEEYILRKDAEGRWKIMGWQPVAGSTSDVE